MAEYENLRRLAEGWMPHIGPVLEADLEDVPLLARALLAALDELELARAGAELLAKAYPEVVKKTAVRSSASRRLAALDKEAGQ